MAASKRAVDILQHVFTSSPTTMAEKELTTDQLRDDPSLWLDPEGSSTDTRKEREVTPIDHALSSSEEDEGIPTKSPKKPKISITSPSSSARDLVSSLPETPPSRRSATILKLDELPEEDLEEEEDDIEEDEGLETEEEEEPPTTFKLRKSRRTAAQMLAGETQDYLGKNFQNEFGHDHQAGTPPKKKPAPAAKRPALKAAAYDGPPRKRGRPPKIPKDEAPLKAGASPPSPPVAAPPRRRGRPPKVNKQFPGMAHLKKAVTTPPASRQSQSVSPAKIASDVQDLTVDAYEVPITPVKRGPGRPAENASPAVMTASVTPTGSPMTRSQAPAPVVPRKRGRPPKNRA
ncbi:hypothetical protein CC79DRAFT_1070841 [Sarocladium strictum]